MTSSTLLYIAWPLTLGLSFIAGSIDLSKQSATENSKDGNQPAKISHRDSSSYRSTNENSAAINRRSSTTHSGLSAESCDIIEILAINNSQERFTKLLRMIDQLGPGDFEQVVADLRVYGGGQAHSNIEQKMVFEAWAKVNPEGALADAKKNAKSTFASKTILTAWAEYAPDAAIQWVKLNHNGNKTSRYLVDIIKVISNTNLERATDMLQELSGSNDTQAALYNITRHASKLGAEEAIAWLATIKDEKLRATATDALVSPLAEKNPQATADWLQTLPVNMLNNNVGVVARAWAEQDLDKATEWTDSLNGKARTLAASQMIRHFVSSDHNKAATWMKTMSGEPDYKRIVSSFMLQAVRSHPELALANLDQIDGDSERKNTRQRSLTSWANKDRAAVTEWMQNNNIDTATQKKVHSSTVKNNYIRHW